MDNIKILEFYNYLTGDNISLEYFESWCRIYKFNNRIKLVWEPGHYHNMDFDFINDGHEIKEVSFILGYPTLEDYLVYTSEASEQTKIEILLKYS